MTDFRSDAMERIVFVTGESAIVRTSRIMQVRDFINSGRKEEEVFIESCENPGTVRSSLYNAISSSPYFNKRCYVVQRKHRIYLMRR